MGVVVLGDPARRGGARAEYLIHPGGEVSFPSGSPAVPFPWSEAAGEPDVPVYRPEAFAGGADPFSFAESFDGSTETFRRPGAFGEPGVAFRPGGDVSRPSPSLPFEPGAPND